MLKFFIVWIIVSTQAQVTQSAPAVAMNVEKNSKVWVSMAVCLDRNTHTRGKAKHPYNEATLLNAQRWHEQVGAKVIVFIITNNPNAHNISPVRQLRAKQIAVEIRPALNSFDCPTTSQIIRMWAHAIPYIKNEDIIVMIDVDAFPISKEVLSPIVRFPSKKAWVWQHIYSEQSGATFPMSIIALRSKDWALVLDKCDIFRDAKCFKSLLKRSLPEGYNKITIWGADQNIITRQLLFHNICSVNNRKVWDKVGLSYKPFDDSETCFHGGEGHRHSGMEPSNRQWLHMSVSNTIEDVKRVLEVLDRKRDSSASPRPLKRNFPASPRAHKIKLPFTTEEI